MVSAGSFSSRRVFFMALEAGKSKVRVLAISVPGGSSHLGDNRLLALSAHSSEEASILVPLLIMHK